MKLDEALHEMDVLDQSADTDYVLNLVATYSRDPNQFFVIRLGDPAMQTSEYREFFRVGDVQKFIDGEDYITNPEDEEVEWTSAGTIDEDGPHLFNFDEE